MKLGTRIAGGVGLLVVIMGAPGGGRGKVVKIAGGGVMLRKDQEGTVGAEMGMEVLEGGESRTGGGGVARCTRTRGGYKVGVKLEFQPE